MDPGGSLVPADLVSPVRATVRSTLPAWPPVPVTNSGLPNPSAMPCGSQRFTDSPWEDWQQIDGGEWARTALPSAAVLREELLRFFPGCW